MEENNDKRTIKIKDEESKLDIIIENPIFYGSAVPKQETSYTETSHINYNGIDKQLDFTYPDKPTLSHQAEMWETLNKFENKAWSDKNSAIKTGYDMIDKGFDGGLYPGFIVVAGDSNLGKTAFMTNLAWNIIVNNDDVYVMDFSLDDSMPDKLGRMIACSGNITINAVKNPKNYINYPLMLARRKRAIVNLYSLTDRYIAFDASTTNFVEEIQEKILSTLIYFDEHKINKKIVVFIDNFHDMEIKESPGMAMKEKFDSLAQWCQDFTAKYDIVLICSAELKKLNGSRRPQLDDVREAVKIKYSAKATLLVYNELHYKKEASNVYYTIANNPYKQPIFEVHFAKNKYHSYKGRVFFEFHPDMALMKECDPQVQKAYTNIVYG